MREISLDLSRILHPLLIRTTCLCAIRSYDRIRTHFYNGAPLAVSAGEDKAITLFQEEMAKVEPFLWCESARWGYLREDNISPKATPYQKTDPAYYPSDSRLGDWDRNTNHMVNAWFPARRGYFFNQAAGKNLYVSISPTTIPNGKVGVSYSQAFSATGGTAPRSWTITAGTSLPPGLTLSGSSLTGVPTTAGTYQIGVTATSADGIVGITELTIAITP